MGIKEWFNGDRSNQLQGGGLFSTLHIVLIVIFFVMIIANYLVSKKNPKYASILIFICCIIMPLSRIARMIMELSFGLKTFVEILPFHLCHLMSFVIL